MFWPSTAYKLGTTPFSSYRKWWAWDIAVEMIKKWLKPTTAGT